MNLVLAMVYLSYEQELSSVEKEVLDPKRDKTTDKCAIFHLRILLKKKSLPLQPTKVMFEFFYQVGNGSWCYRQYLSKIISVWHLRGVPCKNRPVDFLGKISFCYFLCKSQKSKQKLHLFGSVGFYTFFIDNSSEPTSGQGNPPILALN